MENQTQNPMPTAPEAPMPAPAPVEASAAPAMPQTAPASPASSGGSKKMLWIVIAIVVLILVGLGAWYFMALNQANNAGVTGYTTTQQAVATPTPTPTPSGTQVAPIQNASDLNGALNQVNGSSSTQTQSDLNQNAADSSTFSQ